jgi:hypothetical protein
MRILLRVSMFAAVAATTLGLAVPQATAVAAPAATKSASAGCISLLGKPICLAL